MIPQPIQTTQMTKNDQSVQPFPPGVPIMDLLSALPPLPNRLHDAPEDRKKRISSLLEALSFIYKEIPREQMAHETTRARLLESGKQLQEVVKLPGVANLKSLLQNPELVSANEVFQKNIGDIGNSISSEMKDRRDSEQELRSFMVESAVQQVANSPVLGEHFQPIQVAIPSTDPSFAGLASKYDQTWADFLKAIKAHEATATSTEASAQKATSSELVLYISQGIRIQELNALRDLIVTRILWFKRFG